MDDFRLGSISPSDPHHETPSGPANRGKNRRRRPPGEDPVTPEDEFVTSPEREGSSDEPVEDSYSPSHPADESE